MYLKKKKFELIYNRQHYKDFYKIYNRIASSIYMRYLFKHFRFYIEYYSKCEFNQIKYYRFYKNMIFINRSEISFYIITIDFVVIFFVIIDKCDCFFIVIDKFLKRVLMFSGKIIYNIVE